MAYNLSRIRRALGWSQEEAAERLEPYLGVRWSKRLGSAAERSYSGKRVRQFTADDLLAMSLAFGVTIGYFCRRGQRTCQPERLSGAATQRFRGRR